jgi:hypothetical protein
MSSPEGGASRKKIVKRKKKIVWTRHARSAHDVIRLALQRLGWKEELLDRPEKCNVLWWGLGASSLFICVL